MTLFGHGGGAEAERDLSEWLDQHAPSTGQPPVDSVTKFARFVADHRRRGLSMAFDTIKISELESLLADVESLQQQLAAAQEVIESQRLAAVNVGEELEATQSERDSFKRMAHGGLELIDKRTSERDQLRRENEAMRGAMRETVSCARTVLSKLRLSDRPPYAELVALQNAVETAAALDAASTGQPKSNG